MHLAKWQVHATRLLKARYYNAQAVQGRRFSTCPSEIGRLGAKHKPHGPDVRSSLGLGSFGTAGEELATGDRSAILAQQFQAFVERKKSAAAASDRKLCDKFGAELMQQRS